MGDLILVDGVKFRLGCMCEGWIVEYGALNGSLVAVWEVGYRMLSI